MTPGVNRRALNLTADFHSPVLCPYVRPRECAGDYMTRGEGCQRRGARGGKMWVRGRCVNGEGFDRAVGRVPSSGATSVNL